MMKYIYIVLIALASTTLSSCKRQNIYQIDSHVNSAKIEFEIDWSGSNIDEDDINNVSIYAYAEGVDSPYTRISGSVNSAYIYLPAGVYTLLIFNDFVGDIEGINFKDIDTFDQFRAEVIARSVLSDLYYSVQSDEQIAQELAKLATWKMDELVVSEEMVVCSCCDPSADTTTEITLIEAAPTVVTTQCVVNLKVENLNNAAYIEVTLSGFASGVYLSSNTRLYSSDPINLYDTELDSRTYSDDTDGVATGEITTFGKSPLSDQSYEVEINIILNSGELVTYTRDVTDQLTDQNGSTIVIDLTSDDDMISLPESSDVVFGVKNWGDNESVHLQ